MNLPENKISSSSNEKNVYGDLEFAKLKRNSNSNIKFLAETNIYSRVVYNRVGKCGSRSLQNVISKLSEQNGFQYYQSSISNQTHLSPVAIRNEIKLIYHIKPPMLYSRHIFYLNFGKYGIVSPIYINMIRDPIDRFSSHYHFRRNGDMRNPGIERTSKQMNLFIKELDINDCVLKNYTECSGAKLWYIVPYFCGQDAICRRPSAEALQRAKRHLLDNYLVVGFLEDFEGTLQLFEKLLPSYFKGALDIWKEIGDKIQSNTSTYNKKTLKPEVRMILYKRMALEYEFYQFAYRVYNNLKAQVGLYTENGLKKTKIN